MAVLGGTIVASKHGVAQSQSSAIVAAMRRLAVVAWDYLGEDMVCGGSVAGTVSGKRRVTLPDLADIVGRWPD